MKLRRACVRPILPIIARVEEGRVLLDLRRYFRNRMQLIVGARIIPE